MISKKDLSTLHAVRREQEKRLADAKKIVSIRREDLADADEEVQRAQADLDRTLSQLRLEEERYHASKA